MEPTELNIKIFELVKLHSEENFDKLIKILEDENINFKNDPLIVQLVRFYGFFVKLFKVLPKSHLEAQNVLKDIEIKCKGLI